MSYRVSKDRSIPLNASIQDDDTLLNDDAGESSFGIRRALLMLITIPSDWHLLLNEWLLTIDWDSKASSYAQPLGHGLTTILYVIRLLQDNLIRPESYKIASKQDAFDLSRSEKLKEYEYLKRYCFDNGPNSAVSFYASFLRSASKLFNLLVVVLLLVNLGLTYRFFWGNFRTYSLFHCKERPASRHVTKRSLKDLNSQYLENVYNGSLWSMIKYLLRGNLETDEKTNENDVYYSLEKWSPSKFSVYFFASFSPTCVFFLLLCDISFTTGIPVLLHQVVLHYLIIDRYEDRLIDEMVIHQALMADYELKVVRPLTSKKMQDVQVDTTPYGEGYVRFWPASSISKSPIFSTHSVTGDVIREKFNSAKQEFEDVQGEGKAHNLIKEAANFHSSCQQHNAMQCRSFHRCHRDEAGLRKMESPSGFSSSCISTTSGMSSPFYGRENSICHHSGHQYQQPAFACINRHVRRGSTSPLRRAATPKNGL